MYQSWRKVHGRSQMSGAGFLVSAAAPSGSFVYDTFTDTDGTLLDTNNHAPETGGLWTNTLGDSFITSNRLRGAADTLPFHNAATPSSANYDVEMTLYVISTGSTFRLGVRGRWNTATSDYYQVRYDGSDDTWKLEQVLAETITSLGTFGESLSAGNSRTARLSMNGTTIKMIINGTERASVTNSAVSGAGKAGFIIVQGSDTTGYALDTFWAGDVGGTVGP
jgi:hypothetical protein